MFRVFLIASVLFIASSASAQVCVNGRCGLASRPVLGAPARVVERSVLRVRRVVHARPVRRVFAARPLRGLFGGCLRGRCG